MKITQVNYAKAPVLINKASKVSFGESEFGGNEYEPKTQFQKEIEKLNDEVFYKIESIWALYPNSEEKRNEELDKVMAYKERRMTQIYKQFHSSNEGFLKKILNKFFSF